MVFGPQGAPGCLSASTPWFVNYFVNVIVAIAATSAPVGWANIDNVTCLLTPSAALRGRQYQETDKPLQGGHRCWKIPHCHHHRQFTHHCLYCPPRWRHWKQKTLALYFSMAIFLSRLHENPCWGTSGTMLCFHSLNFKKCPSAAPRCRKPPPIAYIVRLIEDIKNRRPLPSNFQWRHFYQDRMKTCWGT